MLVEFESPRPRRTGDGASSVFGERRRSRLTSSTTSGASIPMIPAGRGIPSGARRTPSEGLALPVLEGGFLEMVAHHQSMDIADIIEVGKSIMEEDFDGSTMDACLIAAGQLAEHFEMATYGTLVAWARAMGHNEAGSGGPELTSLAQSRINRDAAEVARPKGSAKGRAMVGAGRRDPAARQRSAGTRIVARDRSPQAARGYRSRIATSPIARARTRAAALPHRPLPIAHRPSRSV